MEQKILTLAEKWKIDAQAYKDGASVTTASPQCEKCRYNIIGNVMKCKKYKIRHKPDYVLFCEKECKYFESKNRIEFDIYTDKDNSLYGGILGFCIGDMIGVPVEFTSRVERSIDPVKELRAYGTYHQGFGVWSDDTSLMIALIASLIDGFSLERLSNYFVKYYKEGMFTPEGVMFDIGNSTRIAIENIIKGVLPTMCGGSTENDNGNGSLMRILPIAFLNITNKDQKKMVESVSSVTHRHKRSLLAGIIYVNFVSNLYKGCSKEKAYDRTIDFVKEECKDEYMGEWQYFNRILEKTIINEKLDRVRTTGYVVDTLEAVFWLVFNENTYEQTILKAVNLGGDTDTIAALAGGCAGVIYGFSSINDRWIQNVAKLAEIKQLIDDFRATLVN